MHGQVVSLQQQQLLNLHPDSYCIKIMQISIIIPVYNEAENIGKLISYLIQHNNGLVAEVIVVDAGSNDDTIIIAKKNGAKTVLSPQKGRAAQMNYGASIAKGDILYFIHADTLPPVSFTNDITTAIQKGFAIGRYRTKFNSRKWYLKINAWITRFDWFVCMGGDNTLFVTRQVFKKNNGFTNEMQIMEEYEFCERVRKEGALYKILPGVALISARKYDINSWWRVQMANKKIISMYRNNASQQVMVDTYKKMLNTR